MRTDFRLNVPMCFNFSSKKRFSIFLLRIIVFKHSADELWLSRSLFVIGGYLLVCIEDFMQFSALSIDASSSTYFSLDSCCPITDVSELVSATLPRLCLIFVA